MTHSDLHSDPNSDLIHSNSAQSSTTQDTNTDFDPAIDIAFDPLAGMADNIVSLWRSATQKLKQSYTAATDTVGDEILIRVSEQQLNDALYRFVTQNVEMVHDLHLELHNDWLRLYATVYTKGVFAKVACNFRLVGIEINPSTQRLIFEQLSDTDILQFHSKTWWQVPVAKIAVSAYRKLVGADPLGFILQKITVKEEPFATHKGKFIYLDISRYFEKNQKFLSYFKKVHVNTAHTTEDNLLAKIQIHFDELISLGNGTDDIISEKDNPERQKTQKPS